MTKKCPKCQVEKSVEEFPLYRGRRYYCCHDCKIIEGRIYRDKYRDTINTRRRKRDTENKEEVNRKRRERRVANPRVYEIEKKYKEANRDKIRKWTNDFYYRYKDKRLALAMKWHSENPDKVKLIKHNYKVKRRLQTADYKIDANYVNVLLAQQNKKCFYCDIPLEDYHIDHIIPLAKGGEHKEYNVVLACPKCNLTKSAKDPEIFVSQLI